jgi:hypothetical protein
VSATSVTLRGQQRAEEMMTDAVVIDRPSGSTVDPDTGFLTPAYTTVYTGKGKAQQAAPAGQPTVVGEAAVFEGQLTLHLPVSVTGPRPDDRVRFTASSDPDLLNRTFHLRGPVHKTYLTARRFPMVEVAG